MQPQMNTDAHRYSNVFESVFICVHLWLKKNFDQV